MTSREGARTQRDTSRRPEHRGGGRSGISERWALRTAGRRRRALGEAGEISGMGICLHAEGLHVGSWLSHLSAVVGLLTHVLICATLLHT